ncbi:hypothetical protein [Hyphomicrobium sp. 2TAF46]|uniref:hypothetical protein n=1 Tax=Hyphomicrobium sp. 2TAF46 TaxID=3233019 RepID=UPI003F8FE498
MESARAIEESAIGVTNDAKINAAPTAAVQFRFMTELLIAYPGRMSAGWSACA